jgi:hypothetical protein
MNRTLFTGRTKQAFDSLPVLSSRAALRPHFKHSNPIVPGVLEVITQGSYDYYEVAAANPVTVQILFTIAQGGSYTPAGGTAFQKQKFHTSLTQPSQLEAPNKLMVKGLSANFRGDIAASDANQIAFNTLVTFNVNGKDYLNIQLLRLPGGGGVFGSANVFQTTAAAASYPSFANGYPEANAIFALEGDGVQIEQQQTFKVILDPTQVQSGAFTTAAAAGTTFGTGVKIIYTLDGLLSRAVL